MNGKKLPTEVERLKTLLTNFEQAKFKRRACMFPDSKIFPVSMNYLYLHSEEDADEIAKELNEAIKTVFNERIFILKQRLAWIDT